MTQENRAHLMAEINFLQQQLAELPQSAKLTRMSTAARLKEVETQLAQLPLESAEPARVRLTFNGRPVIGTYGIFADFGMKAVNSFSDAVITLAASLLTPLAATGRIPNREDYQLLITNTALGSFGFELEEYHNNFSLLEEPNLVGFALEQTQMILHATLSGSDEELADSASEIDPRALDKIRSFLQIVADNEAVCAMQYKNQSVKFSDVGQIKRCLERLSQDNLQETEESLSGEFQGVLPKSRTFEFKLKGQDDEIIKGKIGKTFQDAASLNLHLNEETQIKVMKTRVGKGKPRYVLLEYLGKSLI